jgi:hypothetical protein
MQKEPVEFSLGINAGKAAKYAVNYGAAWLTVHYGFTLTPEQEAVIVGLLGSALVSLRNKIKMAYPKLTWL